MSHNTAYGGKRDPDHCPANQPTTTGEWTEIVNRAVKAIEDEDNLDAGWRTKVRLIISDAHKDALAAERKRGDIQAAGWDVASKQLATAVEALKQIKRGCIDTSFAHRTSDAALTKIGGKP
jgi:hypothetical protein